MEDKPFSSLVGKTIVSIERSDPSHEDRITFTCSDGSIYQMGHTQNCCESVSIEDITGDLYALVGKEILSAAEAGTGDLETSYGDQQ